MKQRKNNLKKGLYNNIKMVLFYNIGTLFIAAIISTTLVTFNKISSDNTLLLFVWVFLISFVSNLLFILYLGRGVRYFAKKNLTKQEQEIMRSIQQKIFRLKK